MVDHERRVQRFMAVEGNDVRSEDACGGEPARHHAASDQASFPMTHGMAAIPRALSVCRRDLIRSPGPLASATTYAWSSRGDGTHPPDRTSGTEHRRRYMRDLPCNCN
ncbi:hypothetical protein PAHAL_9G093600 [Panicum hallii]|uniref:Uncharacterized protein n=1 Tax=Panicum hallii TaxID=206008 RepID=A0A2T8I0S8_9POAL|nr:hypothetical protein PAHAL_9G093600 [Panicum hallii]